MAKLLEYGVTEDVSNKTYHSDDFFTSSTAVKMLYYDIPKYEKEYIQKNKTIFNSPALDMGSFIHTLILEPEKLEEEYAFFPGWDKRESGFKEFKEENSGKIIISQAQKMQAKKMMDSFNSLKIAKDLISESKTEITLCVDLFDVPVKVRFDAVNIEKGEIYDVKTSSYGVDYDTFKMQGINNLKYEVSAGLYTLAASKFFGKPFNFYFVCLSKSTYATEIFKTGDILLSTGQQRAKIGLERLKEYRESGKWPANTIKKQDTSNYEILEL